jgi:hypothetical protein
MAKKQIEVTSLKADTNPQTWAEAPLYWATIRYLRAWYATDGVNVARVGKEKLTPPVLRRITREYLVNRGIASAKNSKVDRQAHAIDDEDASAKLLCMLLNDAAEKWPTSLVERSNVCASLTQKAFEQKIGVFVEKKRPSNTPPVQNEIVSAITKLLWFLRPHGWTMFDNEAASGLGIPKIKSKERMLQFYQKLHELDFQALHDGMATVIKCHDFDPILAPRIVDKVLMAKSEINVSTQEVKDEKAFLAILPKAVAAKAHALGLELQQRFGTHCLILPDAKVVN